MKTAIFFILILFSVLCPSFSFSQSFSEKRADALYQNLSFYKAAVYYESLYEKDPQNGKFIQRLAYCYNKMLNYKKALLYFSYLVQIDERSLADYYEYAQLLQMDGKVDEAKKWLDKYIQLAPDDLRAIDQYHKLDEIITLKYHIKKINVKEVEGNTQFTEMCPAFYNNRVVFSSAKDSFSMVRNEFKWNGEPFLQLYVTKPHPQSNFKEASSFSNRLNTRVHEGPVCFTTDNNTIYFTRNSTIGLKSKKSQGKINNLKIFISNFDGKNWSEPVHFPYNSDFYSVGHPALSPDNQTLYFISDMPGGYGETDIYKSQWRDGQWSKPENLGESINTKGKEVFPFVDKQGILYFSSNGRPGLTGLDIYAAKLGEKGQYLITHFDAPLNSKQDDFGFILNSDSLSGYFTSNRPGGAGADDIYSFSVSAFELQVISKSQHTGKILPHSKIYLEDENGQVIASAMSDKDGLADFSVKPGQWYQLLAENNSLFSDLMPVRISNQLVGLEQKEQVLLGQKFSYLTIQVIDSQSGFIIPLSNVDISEGKFDESSIDVANGSFRLKMNPATDYTFNVTAEGYFPNTVKFTTIEKETGEYALKVALEKLSVGKQFTLNNLYYDTNKSNIRTDAALVLDKLVQVLIENPEIHIEIGSHTDCRATAQYNLKLSQLRSEAVAAYLIRKGILPSRLVVKGFGESQPINLCIDGVDCTEMEHQANRRTVIEILNNDRGTKIVSN